SGAVDVRHFQLRPGELLAVGSLFDRRVNNEIVNDLGLQPCTTRLRGWEVATVVLRPPGGLRRRRAARVAPWHEAASLFEVGPVGIEMAEFREMHPSDVAQRVRNLPLPRRRQLAEAMEDERLADMLEQLPEDEQLRIIEGLDLERVARVLRSEE